MTENFDAELYEEMTRQKGTSLILSMTLSSNEHQLFEYTYARISMYVGNLVCIVIWSEFGHEYIWACWHFLKTAPVFSKINLVANYVLLSLVASILFTGINEFTRFFCYRKRNGSYTSGLPNKA